MPDDGVPSKPLNYETPITQPTKAMGCGWWVLVHVVASYAAAITLIIAWARIDASRPMSIGRIGPPAEFYYFWIGITAPIWTPFLPFCPINVGGEDVGTRLLSIAVYIAFFIASFILVRHAMGRRNRLR